MEQDPIRGLIEQVDQRCIRDHLFYLAKDPIPFRKAHYTVPGHEKNTLDEADDYIQAQLESWGYKVEKEGCLAQPSRRDLTKSPDHRQSIQAFPGDPWYTVYNLYAKKVGTVSPEEIVVVIGHKDSPTTWASPGAYDNCSGTVVNMELARVLSSIPTRRSVWFIWCNEEHRPWSSETAARRARERGDNIVAVFNQDGVGGKSQAAIDANRKVNVTRYVSPEGKWLADLMAEVNETYGVGLEQEGLRYTQAFPESDDYAYSVRGYPSTVLNIGSLPLADPNYHGEGDIPELVDLENLAMVAKVTLGAVARVAEGYSG